MVISLSLVTSWLKRNIPLKNTVEVFVCASEAGCFAFELQELLHVPVHKPLRSYETMLRYFQGTTTSKGLELEAMLHEKEYERGIKISDKQMQEINISKHEILPQWNYTIAPNAITP